MENIFIDQIIFVKKDVGESRVTKTKGFNMDARDGGYSPVTTSLDSFVLIDKVCMVFVEQQIVEVKN